MTKLAVYEKRDIKKDLKNFGYFRHDYVYKKNMASRFLVFIGAFAVVILNILHKFAFGGLQILEIDLFAELKSAGIIVLAFLAAYTVIGTVKYNIEYETVDKRLRRYKALINLFDKIEGEGPEDERERGEKMKTRRLYKIDN